MENKSKVIAIDGPSGSGKSTIVSLLILIIGKYKLLDNLMKFIIILLTITFNR